MLEQIRKRFYPRATSDDEVIRLLIKERIEKAEGKDRSSGR